VTGGCGDWDRIEQNWTLIRYYAMLDHWEAAGPPVHISVAGLLGLIGKKGSGKTAGLGDLDDLINMFPGGMIN
jgi:hypothetical protein